MKRFVMKTRWPAGSRGTTIALAVVILAMIQLLVIGVLVASGDESEVRGLRVQTARAFYAAESGVVIAARAMTDNAGIPAEGSHISLPDAQVEFVTIPASVGGSGVDEELIVQGLSGAAVRRLRVDFE